MSACAGFRVMIVGIKGNEMADKAAKDGICFVITQSKIPSESFFPHIISKLYGRMARFMG